MILAWMALASPLGSRSTQASSRCSTSAPTPCSGQSPQRRCSPPHADRRNFYKVEQGSGMGSGLRKFRLLGTVSLRRNG